MNDMITIFNQLTSTELADYTLFDNLLELHFEKFRYFYSTIKYLDLDNISEITCTDTDDSLTFNIRPKKNKYVNDVENLLISEANKYAYHYAKHFKIDISSTNSMIIFKISHKKIRKEREIYAEDRTF